MNESRPTATELFEDYLPGWPHDAQLTDSWIEMLTDDIADAISERGATRDAIAAAIIDSLGLGGEFWLAIRFVDHPLFGAHQWHSCPKCCYTAED